MNQNSYICRYIREHPDWVEGLAEKKITLKQEQNLAIFNYDIECDFADPIVQEARGIIIDTERLEVVCWPFCKFGNYGESYADTIDWNTARVQEKIDGSIIKLWYNQDRWQWSTNSMIHAEDAHIMYGTTSFLALLQRAENYKALDFSALDTSKTYIFELVAPEQRIIIQYTRPYLYHIGTRSNRTGQEYTDDIGIEKPAEYPLHSMDACLQAAKALNPEGAEIQYEGFVVVDANWHRIKVKSPEYVYAHRVANQRVFTKKRILPLIRAADGSIEELLKTVPDAEVYVRFYQWQYAELKKKIGIAMTQSRAMYEELEHDKRAMAKYLKHNPLQLFCFRALGNSKTPEDILADITDKFIMSLMADYETDYLMKKTASVA